MIDSPLEIALEIWTDIEQGSIGYHHRELIEEAFDWKSLGECHDPKNGFLKGTKLGKVTTSQEYSGPTRKRRLSSCG